MRASQLRRRFLLRFGISASLLFPVLFGAMPSRAAPSAKKKGPETIKLLTWWDYLAPEVEAKLAREGFPLAITAYRTNETGIARLIDRNMDFDVAIVSNFTMPLLEKAGVIAPNLFREAAKSRKYHAFLKDTAANCLPYLWSSTIFVYDARHSPVAPETFADLAKLKGKGFKVSIIDDPFEVAARALGDIDATCKPGQTSCRISLDGFKPGTSFPGQESIGPSDFRSSIDDFLNSDRVAIYGWHGEAGPSLASKPWLKSSVARSHPVIGFDSVCILNRKNRSRSLPLDHLKKFVETLTSPKNTNINSTASQYFSPYENDTQGLTPPILDLHRRIMERISVTSPFFLAPPDPAAHDVINSWWRRLRYEQR